MAATPFRTRSPRETKRLAREITSELRRVRDVPGILALEGNLGSGKTTFIQGLARALGIRERVQSPTFVLAKRYRLRSRGYPWRYLLHVDAYRVSRPQELLRLGLREAFRRRDTLTVIEWADRLGKIIPRSAVWIRFRHGTKASERVLEIRKPNP